MNIAGFEIGAPLASGAEGRVFRGVHVATGEAVAIKLLAGVDTPARRIAFEREAHAMAGFDHPHLLPVYEYGDGPDGAPLMVMPLAEHGDLRRYATQLDWVTAGTILLQVLDGLAHAHARGVVHCDLKPENVLLRASQDGVRAQIADFGIAHALRSADGPGEIRGTPHYMAPEQFVDPAAIGPATDLYALGCIAFELTARRLPVEGRTALAIGTLHVSGPPAPWVDAIGAPPALGAWIARALAKAPRGRWSGAAEARAALRALVPDGLAVLPEPIEAQTPDSTRIALARPDASLAPAPAALADDRLAPPADWRPTWAARERIGLGLRLFGARTRPLVGRDAAGDLIWRRIRGAHEGGGARIVTIEGAQGTGKSHLAGWMGMRAAEVGAARLLSARYADATPDARGLTGLLRALVRLDGDLDRIRRLRGAEQAGPADETIRALAFQERRLVDLAPARTARVVIGWLAQWAAPRLPYLWLDDAQWDDEPFWLAEAALALDVPLVLVMTLRTDALDPARRARLEALDADRRVRRLSIDPLDAGAHRGLIDELLPLAPDVAESLARRTDGHPLFAVHVVADWVAQDALQLTDAGLRPRAGITEIDSLDALWIARITSALGAIEAPALGLAAALGEEVDDLLLAEAAARAGVEVRLDRIRALVRAGLARRTRRGWAFAHGLIRDAVLRRFGTPPLRRACAEVLTTRVSLPADWRVVAEHWRAAGELNACVDAALKEYDGNTGNFTRHDYLPGLDVIERTLDELGAPAHDARRLRLRVRRLAARFARASVEELHDAFQAIEGLAQRHGHLREWAEALRMRAIMIRNSVGPAPAEPLFRQAMDLFERAGLPHAAACAALGRSPCLRAMGRTELAITVAQAALDTFIAHDDVWWIQITRVELADLLIELDRFDPAEALMEEALRLARGLNDLANQARALVRLAERPLTDGRPGLAETYLLQAHALYVADENINANLIAAWRTRVALHQGDIAAAEARHREHLAFAASVTYRDEFPWLAVVPALAAIQRDDLPGWRRAWRALTSDADERWPAEARRDLTAAVRLTPAAQRPALIDLLATLA